MKIKRFFAPDIRSAMKMVKDELGSEAVIMSNRSVDGGVEIVAARDFDEQVIHNKLKNEKAERDAQTRKQIASPNAADAAKPLHVISSSRKRGIDGSIPVNPIRRHMDQYLGYAEKIHLAGAALRQADTGVEKAQRPGERPKAEAAAKEKEEHAAVSGPAFSVEQLMLELRGEMRREMDMLKSSLDSRLAQWPRPAENTQKAEGATISGELNERLLAMGLSAALSRKLVELERDQPDVDCAFSKVRERLSGMLPIIDDDLLETGGIVALVGPTGVGKTTTIAKIAAQFVLRHGHRDVALITTDNFRIGAHEQLSIYGRILDVPVRSAGSAEELRGHIRDFADKRLILIDTAGMGQRDPRLVRQIDVLKQDDLQIKTYLVASSATPFAATNEIIEAFSAYRPQAGILSKTDEAVVLGGALSAFIKHRLPLAFLTDGQQVPEDIHPADAETLVGQCVAGIQAENDYTTSLNDQMWVAADYA